MLRRRVRRSCILIAYAIATLSPLRVARAEAVVHVTLEDASDPGVNGMLMTVNPNHVPAGAVRIEADNRSRILTHEVIVMPWSERPLPYDKGSERVIENRIKILGQVDDLKPGTSGSATVTLKPGTYLLFCNQPSHYRAGMWTRVIAQP